MPKVLRVWSPVVAVLTIVFGAPAPAAASLRCGGRLVSEGDSVLELKARCGPPNHREVRPVLVARGFETPRRGLIRRTPSGPDEVVLAPPTLRRVRYTRDRVETWLYAHRDGDLPRLVTIRRGRVADIETLSRIDVGPDEGCARALPSRGTPLGVVYLACGAPDDRAVWETEESLEVRGVLRRRLVVRERWTYDPGPGRLLRVLEFANGKLLGVETGHRAP